MKIISHLFARKISMHRIFIYKAKSLFKAAIRFKNFLVWSKFSSDSINSHQYVVHLLVVKNVVYAKIAKTAVLSFLYFHPYSKIIIHCDEITQAQLEKTFLRYLSEKSIEIVLDCKSELTWQENKIKVIFSMNGSEDIFMDADLRWNGPITKQLSGLTFFVQEFYFEDRSPFRQIGQIIENTLQFRNLQMYNTSFFSFGGVRVPKIELDSVVNFAKNSFEFYKSANIGKDDMIIVERLTEQIALSVWCSKWSKQIICLKDSDKIFDQSFVESSYFGATGNLF